MNIIKSVRRKFKNSVPNAKNKYYFDYTSILETTKDCLMSTGYVERCVQVG